MRFDFSPARSFLACLRGEVSLAGVLAHPAYRAVFSHNTLLGEGLTEQDIAAAIRGEDSPYYGMTNFKKNLPAIEALLAVVQENQNLWLQEIEAALGRLFPKEWLEPIVLCPIMGYDAGIGHCNHVCVNLNRPVYWDHPEELEYVIIHEAFHAAYENYRPLPDLRGEIDKAGLYRLFFQNEGYAVWTPLALREQKGHPGLPGDPILRDYVVLADPEQLARHVALHDQLLAELEELSVSEFMERAFGSDRLLYRVGAALVREIAEKHRLEAVRLGAAMAPAEFISTYDTLLDTFR